MFTGRMDSEWERWWDSAVVNNMNKVVNVKKEGEKVKHMVGVTKRMSVLWYDERVMFEVGRSELGSTDPTPRLKYKNFPAQQAAI